jgi:ligand-binding sensor domain-containing protein
MREKLIFVLIIILYFTSYSQQTANWKNYTNMKNVADVDIENNIIWAVTDGGIFNYSIQDGTFKLLTKADGIQGNSLTSIAVENSSRIWSGSSEGIINIYDDKDETFNVILDIANSTQINKRINSMNIISDTLIVSSEFGVSLIDINSHLFFDTFVKFGDFITNTRVNYAIKYDVFYVCTDEGIAIQKVGATNLSAPESWNTYDTSNGLASDKTYKIVKYLDTLVAATDKGLSSFNDNQWQPFIPQFDNKIISDIIVTNDSLIILSENKIFIYRNGSAVELYSSLFDLYKLSYNPQVGIAIASSNGVLLINKDGSKSFNIPNGPASNQFPSISVDNNGVLWSASGMDNTGVGFYTFDKEIWKNYDVNNTPEIPHNDIYYVYNSPENIAYLGSWGFGFIRTDGNSFEVFNTENSGMQGTPDDPNFLVITGFGEDSRNNTWILNLSAADRKILTMYTADKNWYHFIIPAAQNRTLKANYNLSVDSYDTKWFSSDDDSRKGLFYFNEMKTNDDLNDDRSGFLTTVDGLNSTDINTIRVDKRGDIWIGTSLGANIITNTETIISSGNPSLFISSVFTLRQQTINDIAVDPLNQKWIATNEGLLFVSSDGSRLLAVYDSKNSPLQTDQIISLAIDENAGIVYAATDRGLTSFETPYSKPLESFDKLFIYPNPFEANGNGNFITIDGLVEDSEIKILTIDGRLIKEFSSPGGRIASWDGTDDEGNIVNSGVYIVVAYDKEGNSIITGKVAVFRR